MHSGSSFRAGRRHPRCAPIVLLLTALAPATAGSQPATLASDIRVVPDPSAGTSPTDLAAMGANAYFAGTSEAHGVELWTSDGTAAATRLVKDIWPGARVLAKEESGSSHPREIRTANGLVFFTADDGNAGREVWRSDGTPAGTFLLKDIFPGAASSTGQSAFIAGVAGTVLFFADDGTHGRELWRTDGTTAGTAMVVDLCPGVCGSTSDHQGPAVFGSALYYAAYDGTLSGALWRSDGTEAGTTPVTRQPTGPRNLTPAGATLFYVAYDDAGEELWATDGTEAGTRRVKDINPGPAWSGASHLAAVGATVFFSADAGTTGPELFTSDGTEAGTRLVKDIVPGPTGSSLRSMVGVGAAAYFTAYDTTHGEEVWRSDGTEAGTTVLRDLIPGAQSSFPASLIAHDGQLVFAAFDQTTGYRLWWSDGSTAGTRAVGGFNPTYPLPSLASATGRAFVSGGDFPAGTELWRSDGTEAGTARVTNIASISSAPQSLAGLDDRVVFMATAESGTGTEPWSSDGTASGTVLLGDLCTGPCSSLFVDWDDPERSTTVRLGDAVLFTAYTPVNGAELWRTDGSTSGTALVADVVPGNPGSYPRALTRLGDRILYTATDHYPDFELWSSDGTEAGTTLVRDINPGSSGSGPQHLTPVGDRLFFRALDPVVSYEWWTSDGTFAGTVPVGDLHPPHMAPIPSELASAGGALYYHEVNGLPNQHLRRTDGTPSGSYVVPTSAENASQLTDVGGILFFRGRDSETGEELWRTNGLPSGTWRVADIAPGRTGSRPTNLCNVGGILYFAASDITHGVELWRSDGTAAGTYMVKDIVPGPLGSIPVSLTEVNGRLYFSAYEPGVGVEPWTSDGTAAGTSRLQDVSPGPESSTPARFTLAGPRLFFTADDGTTGREPWSLALQPTLLLSDAPQAEGDAGSQPATFRLRLLGARTAPVVVTYATADAGAVAGQDYQPVAGTLTFLPAGPNELTVAVPVLGDTTEERDEDFLLTLSPVAGAIVVGAPARGRILNDDSPVTVRAASNETREGDDGLKTIALDVSLSGPRGIPVTVDYATADGTATAPADYESGSGALTFAPGVVKLSVALPVRGDRVPEFDEAFALALSNPVNATVDQDSRAAGTLLNDDALERPGLSIAHAARQEGDLSAPAVFHVVQDPFASYEAIAEAGGSVLPRRLARFRRSPSFAGLGSLVDQEFGRVPSLRWFNPSGAQWGEELVRVSTLFDEPGRVHDVYRLRFYETTLAGPRFVNDGSQFTTLILQNAGAEPVTGEIHFADDDGIPRHTEPFSVAPRGSFVKALADIALLAGVNGSLTIAHDGRYGTLVGKAVAFSPTTGLCFDHLLVPRRR